MRFPTTKTLDTTRSAGTARAVVVMVDAGLTLR